jgi:hypothetical protein
MGEDSAQKDADGAALIGLQPGTMQLLLPGEDIKFSDPADVGGSYEAFQYRTLLACCAAMGVPYTNVSGDLRQANYSSLREGKQAVDQQFARWVMLHVQSKPAADLRSPAGADQGQAHLMTAFQDAVDATFAAFGINAVYAPAGGEPVPARVIATRPDTIVGFGRPASTPRPRPSSCG